MKSKIQKTVLPAVIRIILMLSLTIFAAPLRPAAAAGPVSQYMYDNFDDNATDPALWFIELKDSGPTASETNQRLEITVPANSTGDDFAAWYDSVCQLRGDYDIQVDYAVLTWPLANGVRIGLAENHANMQRISSGRQPGDYPGGPDFYVTTFDTADHIVGFMPTSDLSGKLRLERVGSTINTYYYTNGAWALDASFSDPTYTQDTAFYLGAWSADSVFMDQEVKVAFDNLMINTGDLICPQTERPDLAITQVADQATVSIGDPLGFDITVANNGVGTAMDVALSDTLPYSKAAQIDWSVSGTDAAACVLAYGQLSCNFGDLPSGAVKTISLTSPTQYMDKSSCSTITNTATVVASNQAESRSATASIEMLCPLVFIEIHTDTPSIMAGAPASFTFYMTNYGDGIARDVVAETWLPENVGLNWSIAEVTPAGSCTISSGTPDYPHPELICSFAQMDPLQEVTVTITSPTTTGSCGSLLATAGVTYSNGHGIKGLGASITVNCPALPITVTPDDGPFSAGDQIGFTVEVTNTRSDPAYGVTLIDTPAIPMDWLIDPAISPECSLSSGTWTCNVGTMAPSSTYSVHIFAASSPSTCNRVVENTASVSDSSGSFNSASASLVVDCPDLTITNTAGNETVSTGDQVGFDITVANNGVGTAMDVAISDTLPVATELNWSVGGTDAAACTITAGILSCNFGDLAHGTAKTIKLTSPTQNQLGRAFCPTISHTATVIAYNQPEGRSATASTEVLCPIVYVDIWSNTPSVTAGDLASFTIYVTNYGDGIAREVSAQTTIPENPGLSWTIASVTPTGAAGSCYISSGTPNYPHPELICDFDQIDPGQEVAAVTITSPTTSGSCGKLEAAGVVSLSNGAWTKGKPNFITVNCPGIDTTPPVITPSVAGTLGVNGWYTSDVSLTWSVSDPESTVSSSTGCDNVSITQDQAATSYTCSATSAGGTASRTVSIARDATKPVMVVTGVTEGASYPLSSAPQAGCATTDNLSGVANQGYLLLTVVTIPAGSAVTATCSNALDAAGNAAIPAVVHYTVVMHTFYSFTGFFQPVDNPGQVVVFNSIKAGGAVPVRFSLSGNQGLDIFASGSPSSQQVGCTAGSTDPIEETVPASSSSLSYDPASDTYTYVWKTNKGWAGTCRVLNVMLADGTQHLAFFKFR